MLLIKFFLICFCCCCCCCYFCNSVLPFFYLPEKAQIIITEGNDVELVCELLYGYENNQTITWNWTLNGVQVQSTDKIRIENMAGPSSYQTKLIFKEVNQTSKGFYQCQAANAFGSCSQMIELRIKSK
jgi:hypothetical protein